MSVDDRIDAVSSASGGSRLSMMFQIHRLPSVPVSML